MLKFSVVILCFVAVAQAQRGGARVNPNGNELRSTTTPVPILRQINKVNEDGSYTYGYEGADGSYKVETKSVAGEVQGKYGYYDDTGVLREIEYGASRQGFQPQGTDVRRPESAVAMAHDPIDDSGFYDPERYEKPFAYDRNSYQTENQQQQPARRPASGRRPGGRRQKQYTLPAPAPAPVNYAPQPQYQQQPQQQYQQQPQQQYQQQPQQQYQQQPQQQYQQQQHVVNHQAPVPAQAPPQNYFQQQPQAPQPPPFNPAQLFHGHPAKNIDINTGSYSVQYGHHG